MDYFWTEFLWPDKRGQIGEESKILDYSVREWMAVRKGRLKGFVEDIGSPDHQKLWCFNSREALLGWLRSRLKEDAPGSSSKKS